MGLKKVRVFGIPINKRTVIRLKIYIDRAKMYIGYMNFVMIAFVFLNSINDQRIRSLLDENRIIIYPIVMVLFLVVSLVLGYLDDKLGIRKEELRNYASENPVMRQILTSLEEIKEQQHKGRNETS